MILFYITLFFMPALIWWIVYGNYEGIYPRKKTPRYMIPLHVICGWPLYICIGFKMMGANLEAEYTLIGRVKAWLKEEK